MTLMLLIGLGGIPLACDNEVVGPPPDGEGLAFAGWGDFSAWSPAVSIELAPPGAHPDFNTPFLDGCPFTSRDGKTFYIASNRPGSIVNPATGLPSLDIWVSTRASLDDPWGAPVNVGEPVNSSADDFCPTIDRDGHRFFFVSRRVIEGVSCGGSDIYVTRLRDDGGFEEPEHLGCTVNSAFDEASPFPLPQRGAGPVLYFSSNRPGLGGSDLYMSESHGGVFGPAQLVPGVNSESDDGQPNVRRDGLEIFFFSTRPHPDALGGQDLFAATRAATSDPWSTPEPLGSNVNSIANDSRPSLSWDGTTLYFGSNRLESEGVPPSSDIYVTTREKITGGGN